MSNRLVLEWIRFADNDLRSANHLLTLHPQHLELICYLCQQSTEKYLKAFLVAHDVEPPKIHNLVKLQKLCLSYDATFAEISDQCDSLTDYGVQPRYPDELEFNDTLTQKALAYAQQIKNFAPLQNLRETEGEN